MNKFRTENWCGHDIRFVEINGEWWAILKDICDALNLHTFKISQRLDPSMLERVAIKTESSVPSRYDSKDDIPSKYDNNSKAERSNFTKTVYMLAVNELGIYEALLQVVNLKLVSSACGPVLLCKSFVRTLDSKAMKLCA